MSSYYSYTEEERVRIKAMSRLDNAIAALPVRPKPYYAKFYKAKTLFEAEEIQRYLPPVVYPNHAMIREDAMMGHLIKRNWVHVSGRI